MPSAGRARVATFQISGVPYADKLARLHHLVTRRRRTHAPEPLAFLPFWPTAFENSAQFCTNEKSSRFPTPPRNPNKPQRLIPNWVPSASEPSFVHPATPAKNRKSKKPRNPQVADTGPAASDRSSAFFRVRSSRYRRPTQPQTKFARTKPLNTFLIYSSRPCRRIPHDASGNPARDPHLKNSSNSQRTTYQTGTRLPLSLRRKTYVRLERSQYFMA